jgi:hypothetical protein
MALPSSKSLICQLIPEPPSDVRVEIRENKQRPDESLPDLAAEGGSLRGSDGHNLVAQRHPGEVLINAVTGRLHRMAGSDSSGVGFVGWAWRTFGTL